LRNLSLFLSLSLSLTHTHTPNLSLSLTCSHSLSLSLPLSLPTLSQEWCVGTTVMYTYTILTIFFFIVFILFLHPPRSLHTLLNKPVVEKAPPTFLRSL